MLFVRRVVVVWIFFLLVASCGSGAINQVSNLTLLSTDPVNGEIDVPANKVIILEFLEGLDPSSISSETIHLFPVADEVVAEGEGEEDLLPEVISTKVSYDVVENTITIFPNMPLPNGQKFKVHLSDLKLKGGGLVVSGTRAIEFEFTVAHVHESRREVYEQKRGDLRKVYETTFGSDNKMIQRIERNWNDQLGRLELASTRHYNTTLPTGEYVAFYESDQRDFIVGYRREVDTAIGEISANYYSPDGDNYKTTSWWSSPTSHEQHEIRHHYIVNEESSNIGVTLDVENPTNGFQLRHVSLMEMNHTVTFTSSNPLSYRYVLYSDLGQNTEIDFNRIGEPLPVDDTVIRWNTREYDNGKRKFDWTWLGHLDTNGQPRELDDLLPSQEDLATSVNVHEYDETNRRIEVRTYISQEGMSRDRWRSLLNSNAADLHLSQWKTYLYDVNSGNLSEVLRIKKCDAINQSGSPMACQGYQGRTDIFLEQRRFYSMDKST